MIGFRKRLSSTPRRSLAVGLTASMVLTGLALATAAPAAAAPDVSDNKLVVIQHNTDQKGYGEAEAAAAGDVDAITLQELCESDANALRAGWNVHWRVQRDDAKTGCPVVGDRQAKGIAIVSRHKFAEVTTDGLGSYGPADAVRHFKLICAKLAGTGIDNAWVCTTHLSLGYGDLDGSTIRKKQVNKITNQLNGWVADGRRVVLTGDFNAFPNTAEMEPLYRVTAGGTDGDRFWEGDQSDAEYCGAGLCRDMQRTTDPKKRADGTTRPGRKLDYFFASWRGVDPHSGVNKVVQNSDSSGHHIIRGEVTFKRLT